MGKYKLQYVIIGFVILILCLFVWFCWPSSGIPASYEKTLRFTYTLKNTSNEFISHADFTAMIPIEYVGAQHIDSIVATQEYQLINDDATARSVKFDIHNFPPYATKVISMTVALKKSSAAQKEFMWRKKYIEKQQYIELDAAIVKEKAAQVSSKKTVLTAKNAYEWLINNVKDSGYVSENKGAQFALEKRLGDCTEYMYAFVALARANGIPARGVAGFVVQNSAGVVNSADYHNWAEFYDGNKWILVDPQKHVFDEHYENYIATRFIGSENDTAMSASRFLTTDKRISISF